MNDAIRTGITFGLLLIISVGPTVFAILKYSIQYGHLAGFSYILGVSLSDILYVFLINKAANDINFASHHIRTIGVLGALLLIAMGLYGYFKKLIITRPNSALVPIKANSILKIGMSGFFMNALNSGVILTWIGMAAFVGQESLSYRVLVFLITLGMVLSGDILKVLMAMRVRKLLTPRNIVYLSRISAICLFAIGIFLLFKFGFNIKIAGQ